MPKIQTILYRANLVGWTLYYILYFCTFVFLIAVSLYFQYWALLIAIVGWIVFWLSVGFAQAYFQQPYSHVTLK